MNSLPEQHVDSLPKHKRAEAYRQIGMVCAFRGEGRGEDEVAKKANFRDVKDMYFRLKRWGLWGLLPLEEETEEASKTVSERLARGSGPVEHLPPSGAATPLFREILDLLGQANEDLKHRNEWRQGGRFLVTYEYEDAEHGATTRLEGGTKAPQFPLPALIATYALMGRGVRIKELLEALHPGEPDQEVREEIRKLVDGKKGKDGQDGLKVLARQLARLVRGGGKPVGAPRPDTPAEDFYLGCSITERREAGGPDEQIYEELRRSSPFRVHKELTWKEFLRLAELGFSWSP